MSRMVGYPTGIAAKMVLKGIKESPYLNAIILVHNFWTYFRKITNKFVGGLTP